MGRGRRWAIPSRSKHSRKPSARRRNEPDICGIGSVKSNIGHLDRAAGVASLIKTVLAIEHRQMPATLHFRRPNPDIDFDATPFYVVDRLTAWKSEGPRRALVNSLGFGGTNACVVLEEPPPPQPPAPTRPYQLLALSARTEAALDRATKNLADHLERHPETSLGDAAYTLHVGRRPFEFRRVVVCRDTADAVEKLKSSERQGSLHRSAVRGGPSGGVHVPGSRGAVCGHGRRAVPHRAILSSRCRSLHGDAATPDRGRPTHGAFPGCGRGGRGRSAAGADSPGAAGPPRHRVCARKIVDVVGHPTGRHDRS